MVGVKKGALNFPKMLRALGHRTNQVRKLGFYRSPLYESAVATTKDVDKDGIREARLRGPAVNFGYTETQSMSKSIPDWSEGKTYYETTWALNFPNSLNSLQVPKISGDSTTGLTGQTSKGTCDFYVPSYKIINGLSGFGGNQTDGGRAASVVFGKTANPGQGEFGGYQTVGQMFGPNYHNERYGDDIAVTDEILDQLHWARWPPQKTIAGQLEDFYPTTHKGVKSPAIELKVGDVICADSHENRQFGTNSQSRAIVNDVTDGAYWSYILKSKRYTAYDSDADRIGDYVNYRVPPDGETITITDGHGTSVTFEFDVAGNGAAGSNTAITGGDSTINLAAAICDAVNASSLDITALNYIPARDGHPDSPYFILGGNTNKKTAQLFLQQNVAGVSGQTAITVSGQVTAQYFGFDRDRPSESNYGPAEGNTDGDNTRLYSLSSTDWDGNKRGFDTEAPELILIKSIEGYHNHPEISEGDAAPTVESHATSNVTQVGVVRGYNGTTPRTSQKLPGRYGWSNHDPFWYLVKRGYAFAILDVQNSGSVDETITIISTDGTSKTYTCKATADYANNQWSRAGADHGVASFKAAVEHASGHQGKIEVELKSYTGTQNPWTVILKQKESGTAGNTTVTEGLTGWTISNQFAGGSADTNVLEDGTTLTLEDTKGNTHTFTTDKTLKEYESTHSKIGTNLTKHNASLWQESISIAFLKALNMSWGTDIIEDYRYRFNPTTDIKEGFDMFPLQGSSSTSKLDMTIWEDDFFTMISPYYAITTQTGKNHGYWSDTSEGIYYSHTTNKDEDGNYYPADWSLKPDNDEDENYRFADASGIRHDFIGWLRYKDSTTLTQKTKGRDGNTKIGGNSPNFSNVGNWWGGMWVGDPQEQTNRRFFFGETFKGLIRQSRGEVFDKGQDFDDVYEMKPYFYHFKSGDLLTDVRKEVYSPPNQYDVGPHTTGHVRPQIVTYKIGWKIPQGQYLSGAEVDRLKFKAKLTNGMKYATQVANDWTSNSNNASAGLGTMRAFNQYKEKWGPEPGGHGIGLSESDKSININYIRVKYIYQNTPMMLYFTFNKSINIKVGQTIDFDLPLRPEEIPETYLFTDNFSMKDNDGGDVDVSAHNRFVPNYQLFRYGAFKDQGSYDSFYSEERADGTFENKHFFSTWIDGEHILTRVEQTYFDMVDRETHEDPYHELFGGPLKSPYMYDISTGEKFRKTPDGQLYENIHIGRCTGEAGNHIGWDGLTISPSDDEAGGKTIPFRFSHDPYGRTDVEFGIGNSDGTTTVKMDFTDISFYSGEKWRVNTVQEYKGEYIKLSCIKEHTADLTKRRAYGK